MPDQPSIPTLSRRTLQRTLLGRQLLLERADLSIPEAIEQVGGLQTQYAPSGYVGLWTRLARFERAALTTVLEARSAVQATLMRTTIHVVSAREFWRYALGVRQARRASVLRIGLWIDLVRVPPSGTWERRRADRLALAEAWVGPADATEDEALAHLVRAYLRAFGPAAWRDMASWAGLSVTDLKR